MEFTYNAYEQLIKKVMKNYTITDYQHYIDIKRPCILRHDIDMSIQKAVAFSEIESNLGIHSTYFILISSDFYNIYSKESSISIRKIIENGHKIGLHFDEMRYGNEFHKEFLEDMVLKEADILSSLIQESVKSVSMHRPSKEFLKEDMNFNGIVNSYSKEFFEKFKYVSDSRMCWREDIDAIVENSKENALHILTHPFWYNNESKQTKIILMDFIQSSKMERYQNVKDNFRNLDEFLQEGEI